MARGTVSGRRLVIALAVVLLAALVAYPFVRHAVVAAAAREQAAERARDRERVRPAAPSGSIAP